MTDCPKTCLVHVGAYHESLFNISFTSSHIKNKLIFAFSRHLKIIIPNKTELMMQPPRKCIIKKMR